MFVNFNAGAQGGFLCVGGELGFSDFMGFTRDPISLI